MRVLFLDIDGVLNSVRTACAFGSYPYELTDMDRFDPVAIALIQGLCRAADLSVVLSSAWRRWVTAAQAAEAFGLPIVDVTPTLNGPRGLEIQTWLNAHPEVESYAIVDDDPDMMPQQMERFANTSGFDGLQWGDFSHLCELFGLNPHETAARNREWRKQAQETADA